MGKKSIINNIRQVVLLLCCSCIVQLVENPFIYTSIKACNTARVYFLSWWVNNVVQEVKDEKFFIVKAKLGVDELPNNRL